MADDFIAPDDIFIDAEGKVVDKKDAQTKLASKGARLSAADVEKYGLQQTAPKQEPEPEPEPELKGKLPEGFPGLTALEAAGLTTYTKVRKELAKEKPFEDVDGVGPATAEKIRAAINDSSEDDEEEDRPEEAGNE